MALLGRDRELATIREIIARAAYDRLARLPPAAAEPLAAVAGLAAPTVAAVVAAVGNEARYYRDDG